MPTAKQLLLKAKGYHTSNNPFSEVQDGAMTKAQNCVIDFPGKTSPRRGFEKLTETLPSAAYATVSYNDTLVFHAPSNDTLYKWDDTTGDTAYSGTYAEPSSSRVRFLNSKQNLYFNTTVGLYRLESLSSTPEKAGVLRMPDPIPTLVTTTPTWLPNTYQTAYRVLVGKVDANTNLLLGEPSGPIRVVNTGGAARSVSLDCYLPGGLTANHFVRFYRTKASDPALIESPGDEYQLVQEVQITAGDLSTGIVTFVDTYEDNVLGEPLYTNATQDGILASNTAPPLSKDVVEFKGHTLYLNTSHRHALDLSLVARPADGSTIKIAGHYYEFDDSTTGWTTANYISKVGRLNTADLADDIEDMTINLVGAINDVVRRSFLGSTLPASNTVGAYYNTPFEDFPGSFRLVDHSVGGSAFYVTASTPGNWFKQPPKEVHIIGLSRAGTVVTGTTSEAHGFSIGNVLALTAQSASANFAVGNKTLTAASGTTFTYTEAGAAVTEVVSYNCSVSSVSLTALASNNAALPNGIGVSRLNQPESVPYANFREIGAKGSSILRGAALKDAAFIFKQDGLWVITGEGINSFRFEMFDPTTKLIAPESVVVLGNAVYALTNQGFVRITPDGGVTILSRNFEDNVQDLVLESTASGLTANCWAVGYESDRKYIVTWPSAIASETTKTWVYNILTNTWTKWVMSESYNCGIVSPANDKLYMVSTNVARERKTRTYMDHADTSSAVNIEDVPEVNTLEFLSTSAMAAGDALVQGAFKCRITSIDSATIVTVDNSTGFTAGAATLYKAFAVQVEWVVQTGQDPGKDKHWQELEVFLGATSNLRQFYVDTATENGAGTDVTITYATLSALTFPNSLRVDLDRNVRRSSQLIIGITHTGALEELALHGVGMLYRTTSDRFKTN